MLDTYGDSDNSIHFFFSRLSKNFCSAWRSTCNSQNGCRLPSYAPGFSLISISTFLFGGNLSGKCSGKTS
ncbi:hypothetical protein Plhal304r1_c005g0018921 [Plasmopara halstedii]